MPQNPALQLQISVNINCECRSYHQWNLIMVSFWFRDTSSRGGKRFRKLPREVSSPGAVTDDSIASESSSERVEPKRLKKQHYNTQNYMTVRHMRRENKGWSWCMFPRNRLGIGISLPKSDLIDGLFSLVSFFFKSAIDENKLKSVATGNNRRTGKAIKQDC